MPVATLDPNKWTRYELKTAPADPNIVDDENGWVMLRPLPFGMLLQRTDDSIQMQMKARRPQDRQRKGAQQELPDIDMKNLNRKATEYDFSYCIGDHNLVDIAGNKLDFNNPLIFSALDPRIAQEISGYIDELNTPEDEETAEDFMRRVASLPGEEIERS